MAILYFGGFDRFKVSDASAPLAILPTNRNIVPFPVVKDIRFRFNGEFCGWRISQLPNAIDSSVMRNWLEVSSSNSSKSASTQYFEMGLFSRDIPDKYKVVGNTVCAGFRIRSNTNVLNQTRWLVFVNIRQSGVNINTGVTAASTSSVTPGTFPLDNLLTHGLNNEFTSEKYVEYRIRYLADNVCQIRIYVNKDMVFSTEMNWSNEFALIAGNPKTSGHWKFSVDAAKDPVSRGASFFNDFYVGVDSAGDENPTGLVGPVTAKALELEEPEIVGNWTSSNKERSFADILSQSINDSSNTVEGDYVISDPADRPAYVKFKKPDDSLKIVGFRQEIVAQQPMAYATSMQFAQVSDGKIISNNGKKNTVNIAIQPKFERIATETICFDKNGESLTPEYIENFKLSINSVKKLIEDEDAVEEEEEEIIEAPAD